jgi:hypothetical protein
MIVCINAWNYEMAQQGTNARLNVGSLRGTDDNKNPQASTT